MFGKNSKPLHKYVLRTRGNINPELGILQPELIDVKYKEFNGYTRQRNNMTLMQILKESQGKKDKKNE